MVHAVEAGNIAEQGGYKHNIALAYENMEMYEIALEFYQEALKLKKKAGDSGSSKQASTYHGLGSIYAKLDRYPEALEAYRAAQSIYHDRRDLNGLESEASVLAEIGRILKKQGKYREAIEAWESSRTIRENLGYRASVAKSLADISSGYWSLGEYQQAIEYRQRAFDLYQEVGDARNMALALTDLGSLYWITGDYDGAAENYQTALAIHRRNQNRGDEADEQARSFQGREFELVHLLKEEQRKPRGEQREELVERWQNELDQVRLEFGDFRRQLEKDHPEIYRSLQIEPADLRRLQRNLRVDEVFIEPVVLPDRIVTFVVRGGSGQDDFMLPPLVYRQTEVAQERVDGLLRQMRHGLENAGVDWSGARGTRLVGQGGEAGYEDPAQASQALYALLIEPLHSLLDSATTLIISPSGRLRYIPFQALHDGERFLVEKHCVTVVTRVGAFEPHQAVDIAQTGILALANPDGSLEAAEVEVREIRKIWRPFEAYYGPEATMENLRDNARYYPIIHLATHGVLRNDRPQESFLLMAGGRGSNRLTFREISLLPLERTYLATLSACQTALGDKGEGSEISGLAYEFEQQGAATVVASLWAVNDASTADFMIEFYSRLRQPEVSKAEALQAAQLKLLAAPETQHPYFWAPFIMIGDWRK